MVKLHLQEIWKSIKSTQWKIKQGDRMLCLKSSYPLHRCNLAWEIYPTQNLESAKNFFKGAPYFVYNKTPIYNKYLKLEGKILEMKHVNDVYSSEDSSVAIEYNGDTCIWTYTLAKATNMCITPLHVFIQDMKKDTNLYLILIYTNNTPIGTSALTITSDNILISFVSVLEKYRNKGFAKKMINAAIHFAKSKNSSDIFIYAPDRLMFLYKNSGFQVIQNYYYYRSESYV